MDYSNQARHVDLLLGLFLLCSGLGVPKYPLSLLESSSGSKERKTQFTDSSA